ncbi:death-associated protein kinase 1-like isoform X2 [Ptychodera flava]|uniref:death-associated protein kinase 1-like isoform X2 n=1 Tax=Ptychodera flava TaxID=63121 RepID=UPI00396A11FF
MASWISIVRGRRQELIDAAAESDIERIKLLVAKEYDVNGKGIYTDEHGAPWYGSTALHVASREGNVDIAQVLISNGCNVNTTDANDWTPLHYATRFGKESFARLLLQSGAEIDVQDKDGNTPLHLAAQRGVERTATLLLEHKASINIKNKDGEGPLDIVKRELSNLRGEDVAKAFIECHYDNNEVCKTIINAPDDRDMRMELLNHQKSFLEAKTKKRSKEKAPASGADNYVRTPGIDVDKVHIYKVGTFSVWDFAGQVEYYITHNMFLRAENAIFLLLFNITDEPAIQEEEVNSWLAFIKAIIMRIDGKGHVKPIVILIASRADLLKDGAKRQAGLRYREVFEQAQRKFGRYLNIAEEIFILNCHDSQHADMMRLRECLRGEKKKEFIPKLCAKISDSKEKWVDRSFPIVKWHSYVQKVREIDPMVDTEFLAIATRFLHYSGEILRIESTLTQTDDIVVLNPQWLCNRVIGPMLATEIFEQYTKRLPDKTKTRYQRSDFEKVFDGLADIDMLIDLLCEMELLYGDTDMSYIVPGLLQNVMPEHKWQIDQIKKIYYGRRLQCRNDTDSFSPGMFPRLQTRLGRHFRCLNCPKVSLWKNGIKICHNVECLVYMTKGWRAIHVCVRAEKEEEIGECHKMLELVTDYVYHMVNICCPGTSIDCHILSSHSLRNHRDLESIVYYLKHNILKAERMNEKVNDDIENKQEETSSLLCIGHDTMVLRRFGYLTDVKWMLNDTLQKISLIMDRKKDFGPDYRVMADLMGFHQAEVAVWEVTAFPRSITKHILSEWSKRWAKRKHEGGSATEGECIYESNFTNLLKILSHRDCQIDTQDILQMFKNL